MIIVTAVMPTRGRHEMAQRALRCYMAQTYEHKKLVILDDADDPSFAAIPSDIPNLRYERSRTRIIPKKRNEACALADGDIIMHFDSDDWSAPARMADQVEMMMREHKAVSGYNEMILWDERINQAWRYFSRKDYVLGTSLTFTTDWWKKNPFNEGHPIGSDGVMGGAAAHARQLAAAPARGLMIATIHRMNSAPKNIGTHFRPVPREHVPAGYFA